MSETLMVVCLVELVGLRSSNPKERDDMKKHNGHCDILPKNEEINDISRDWYTIKTEDEIETCASGRSPHRGTREWGQIRSVTSKSNPFGSIEHPRTNVWNHEWTSQYRSYLRKTTREVVDY